MKRTWYTAAAALLLAALAPRGASATTNGQFFSLVPPNSTILGYYVWGNDSTPRGFSIGNMDAQNNPIPIWDIALDPTTYDLFIYNRSTGLNSQLIRVRADTGQITVGQTNGSPTINEQLSVWGGTASAPRDGMSIKTWSYQNSLNLLQQSGSTVSRRTLINFNGLWNMGTDTGAINNPNSNWYLQDLSSHNIPLLIDPTDTLFVRNGLQVSGALQHALGGTLGFYGASPVGQQTVSGCRTDGTALASLLMALKNLGLIKDTTTP